MKETELKPCKCGCEADLIDIQTFAWCDVRYFVRCTNPECDERTHKYQLKGEAIEEWNRRARNEQRGAD